jgi:ribonucleotide reductase beta subunit family protein with ferritin-like domain
MKWIVDKEARYAVRLVAFAAIEGIFFSGAFCSIFWLKERGLMPGLCVSNEFISRDESLHTEFAILLYSMLKHKLDESVVHSIIIEAVTIEDEFINDSIPCALLGMNGELMSQYIKFVADRLVVQLGYNKIYNVSNPFHFMDRISLGSKTNFFEQRVSEYARPSVSDKEKPKFTMDNDF